MGDGLLRLDDRESKFVRKDKVHIVSFRRSFWPDVVRIGVRTPRGSVYWRTLLDNLYAFVEDQASESLEIPRIPIVYCNDAFLRTRKRLDIHADLTRRASGVERKSKSLPMSREIIAAREVADEVEDEEEGEEGLKAPVVRKSKRLAKGKVKVIHPDNPKRQKDLPKLVEVPRKKRKLLDASTTATAKAKTTSPHPSRYCLRSQRW